MTNRTTRIEIALLLCSVFILGGCSHFDCEWDAAGEHPSGIDGRWQGTWKSEQDGHTGALLSVIRQTGGEEYDASFNATYGGFLHFSYDAKLTGRHVGNLVYLTGNQDLGWPVGMYRYEGNANQIQFYCAYQSKDDHGYFALARPGGTPPGQPLIVETK